MRTIQKSFFVALTTLLSLQVAAQKPAVSATPKNMTITKPYWVLGDSRTLALAGEVVYYSNDSAVQTLKAKWEGAIEVVAADGKNFSVSILETVVDDKITYSDLLADIETYNSATDYIIKMDKIGKMTGVDNFEEVKKAYIDVKSKDQKSENKKISKEEKQAFTDSISQALLKNDMFRNTIMTYGKNFLDIYGKMIPSGPDTVRDMTSVNTKRFFAAATKDVDAEQTMYLSDLKPGSKFTLNEVLEYSYAGMQDFLVGIKVKDPVFEDETRVRDFISTTYDVKLGWPTKISEELTVTNGKYKVVYKWNVKFNKDK